MTSPTLQDLEVAKAALVWEIARQDNYDGNNPNKYVTNVRRAREEVNLLTHDLKILGLLPRTAHEELEARLNAAFPKARHKDEVEFEGAQYRRWASPATVSRSGRAMTWNTGWTQLTSGPTLGDLA